MNRAFRLAAILAAMTLTPWVAGAETIQTIVPFPAGGPLDSVARLITSRLQQGTADAYVIDNRSGANGMLGAKAAASAKPDGRTWLFSDGALITVNPRLYPKDPDFDPEKDLKVVAAVAVQPAILVVNPNSGWKTLPEFVSQAKKQNLTYASGGIGSSGHLTMALFADVVGIDPLHVPYKGAAPAMTDLLGGQVSSAFVSIGGAISHVQSGKLRALAVSSPRRLAAMPTVPTVKEAGGPDFVAQGMYFVMVPAKTPSDIAAAIGEKVLKAASDKSVIEKMQALGMEAVALNAAESAKWLAAERDRMGKLITTKNIKAE